MADGVLLQVPGANDEKCCSPREVLSCLDNRRYHGQQSGGACGAGGRYKHLRIELGVASGVRCAGMAAQGSSGAGRGRASGREALGHLGCVAGLAYRYPLLHWQRWVSLVKARQSLHAREWQDGQPRFQTDMRVAADTCM